MSKKSATKVGEQQQQQQQQLARSQQQQPHHHNHHHHHHHHNHHQHQLQQQQDTGSLKRQAPDSNSIQQLHQVQQVKVHRQQHNHHQQQQRTEAAAGAVETISNESGGILVLEQSSDQQSTIAAQTPKRRLVSVGGEQQINQVGPAARKQRRSARAGAERGSGRASAGNTNCKMGQMDGNQELANPEGGGGSSKLSSGNSLSIPPTPLPPPPAGNGGGPREARHLSERPVCGAGQAGAVAANICAGCAKPIKERYLLVALDKQWHEDCLKCACCDCRLGEVGSSLFTHSGKILCRRDFLRIFGQHGHCAACKKSIPPYEMVMRAQENAYHMDCFACQQCQYRFCVGDRFHLTETHQVVCVLCQSEAQQQQQQQQQLPHQHYQQQQRTPNHNHHHHHHHHHHQHDPSSGGGGRLFESSNDEQAPPPAACGEPASGLYPLACLAGEGDEGGGGEEASPATTTPGTLGLAEPQQQAAELTGPIAGSTSAPQTPTPTPPLPHRQQQQQAPPPQPQRACAM